MMKTNRRVLSIACACVFALSTASLATTKTASGLTTPGPGKTCTASLSVVRSGVVVSAGHYADSYYNVLQSYAHARMETNYSSSTKVETDKGFKRATAVQSAAGNTTYGWGNYWVKEYNSAHTSVLGMWGSTELISGASVGSQLTAEP